MKDNLEKFIIDNRDEFEVDDPPAKLWTSIQKKTSKKHFYGNRYFYPIAASVLFLIGSYIGMNYLTSQKIPAQQDKEEVVIIPEVKEAEVYYTSLVDNKKSEIGELGKPYQELCMDFDKELDTLHLLYGQLKEEYRNSNGNEAVMQAMIKNLQLQVQLLNKQLQIIQEIRNNKGNKGIKTT